MVKLPIKLPRSFEKALGYGGKMRWVAFYWTPAGDEAVYDDGFCSGDGNWHGFLSFVDHAQLMPHLQQYNLGSSDFEAEHWLLADLENREIWVGPMGEIAEFVRREAQKQFPAPVALKAEIPQETLGQILSEITKDLREKIKTWPVPSMEEIEKRIAEDLEAVEMMVKELNEWVMGGHEVT
jgi:hypothetical protein